MLVAKGHKVLEVTKRYVIFECPLKGMDGFKSFILAFFDFKNLVAFGHKQSWRPQAANRGFCEFNDVVAFGHNQL